MNKINFPLPLFLLFLVACTAFPPIYSQEEDGKTKDMFLEAESFFLFEEYKDALPLYQRILQVDPENFNINYKIGICYLNDIYQKHKSIQYLEKAIKGTSPAYKQNNFKERMAPLEAFYYLGNAYRVNNRLNEALETYNQFKQVLDPVVYDMELVDDQIKACKVAADLQSRPYYYISFNLGETINDRFEEIHPVISGDETVIVFNRKLQFYDAIFYSEKRNGKWSSPINLTPSFAVDGNSYCTGISYDGKELFVYRPDEFDGNLYVSKREDDKWSKLIRLNDNINTKYWESHASPSKDGKTLYFTSNRKDGYGGLDIYKSERTRNEDWGPAVNLGPVINSKYNEESPFVSEDGKILFFSSLGHYNMGGYDIFYSSRLDNGQWSKPVNIGYPINTTDDDLFFAPLKNGEYAYYSTYDATDSYGLADIYKLEVFSELHPRKFILNGITRIEDEIKVDYGKILVSLLDQKTKKVVDQARVNENGTFTLNATSGDFEMVFQGEGIEKTSENLSIPINNPSNIITYTSPLIAPGISASSKTGTTTQSLDQKKLPTLISNIEKLDVTTGDPIPIKLELERNSKLKIEIYLDGILKKTEEFEIIRKKFIYLFKPEPGNNVLKLTLTDEMGNRNSLEIVVNYVPSADDLAKMQTKSMSENLLIIDYQALLRQSTGNLREFLEKTHPDSLNLSSLSDLYNYLIRQAGENGYTVDDVDRLFIKLLSGKDINIFRGDLQYIASGNLKTALDTLDIRANNLVMPTELLDLLYNSASVNTFTQTDLRRILTTLITSGNNDLARFIRILEDFGNDTLVQVLGKLNSAALGINQPDKLIDYLLQQYPDLENNLDTALKEAAASLDLMFLYQSLLYVSGDSLKKTVSLLNLEKEKIRTAQQLIDYLWKKSSTNDYTKEELMNTINNIRKDPYRYVEMFRKLLSSKATGNLKTVIDELDIRAMHIDTFEELLDYLIRQSEFHDYNRETVYMLLLDIINPANLEEFISLLKRHADQNILDALVVMNNDLYSTPMEVIQYLLTVSNDYNYTERDILNLLLKLILEKGFGLEEPAPHKGFLHYFTKPGLARNLIIVNVIVLIIIIILVFRKKSRKE